MDDSPATSPPVRTAPKHTATSSVAWDILRFAGLQKDCRLRYFAFDVSGFAGNAHKLIAARVIGFEILPGEPPIHDGVIFGQLFGAVAFDRLRIQIEKISTYRGQTAPQCSPAPPVPVPGRKVPSCRMGTARSRSVVAQRDRFLRIILHHAEAHVELELVHAAHVVGQLARRRRVRSRPRKGKCASRAAEAISRPDHPPPMITASTFGRFFIYSLAGALALMTNSLRLGLCSAGLQPGTLPP